MEAQSRADVPVLIVGAGPTGLMAAAELARHGVRCRLVDRADGPTPLSKATTVQARTLELLERHGVHTEVIESGHRSHGVIIHSGATRLMHFAYDDLDSPYPFVINIPQSGMERILGDLVARNGVSVEWRTELTGFTQDADGVTATLRRADGAEETVRAAWLVGTDGAHSFVRHALNIPFGGHTYQQWFALADVDVHWSLSHDELHLFVHPRGAFIAIPMPGEHRFRIIVEAEEPETTAELTLEDFQAAMVERGLGDARLSNPGWMTPFRVNARHAARLRDGRAFIAGDAAHIHSPAGGQGMNTGMQDALNLAWKLALVVRGHASEALLDSYEAERLPVAEALLRLTDRLTGLLIMHNAFGREIRNHVMPVLSGFTTVRHRAAVQDAELDVGYRSSPIVLEHHRSRCGAARFAGGPHAGERAPDAGPLERAGARLTVFDVLRGAKHALLLFGGPSADAGVWAALSRTADAVRAEHGEVVDAFVIVDGDQMPASLEHRGAALLDVDGAVHDRYHAEEPCAYLVRPDGYVAFRGLPVDDAALRSYLGSLFTRAGAAST